MNWSNVRLILLREIRDQLRDRRTLFMIAVLPLLLYPLLGMSLFQLAQFLQEHPTKVLVVGAEELAELSDVPRLIENDQFAGDLFSKEEKQELFDLTLKRRESVAAGAPFTRAEAQKLLGKSKHEVVVYFPPTFAEELTTFRERIKERIGDDGTNEEWVVPAPQIFYSTASEKSQIGYARVAGLLKRWTEEIGQQNLRDSKLPLIAAKPFDLQSNDVAGEGHKSAATWARILPFVLLIWALTGAFYPAIDLCAGEKERGTLETLLSSPAQRSEIVFGKLITVMFFSMATALLNLLSMGATGAFVLAKLNQVQVASTTEALSLPPLSALLWMVVALIPVSALFSALCLALAAFARSTKEGQYYLMPLVMISMPLMLLPLAPNIELSIGNSLIPITGVVLLLKTVLEGHYLQAAPYVIPVLLVTLACCWFAMRWAVDQFNRESVLFRESERLDLGLWLQHVVRDRGPTPTVAEGLLCCVLILIVGFFMQLAMSGQFTGQLQFNDVVLLIAISQLVVIATPALLMTLLLTSSPRKTLLLERPTSWLAIPVAVLLAVVLHPAVSCLGLVVQSIYPMAPEVAQQSEQVFGTLLNDSPYPWLPFVLIALVPAICEELAFRGFVLSGMRHIGHKWWAIGITAVAFGMAHTLFQQSIITAFVGLALGYLAVQTNSLLPPILFHLTHNSLAVLSDWLREWVKGGGHDAIDWMFEHYLVGGEPVLSFSWPVVVAGAAIAGSLFHWLHQLPHRKSQEEELQEALEHQGALEAM